MSCSGLPSVAHWTKVSLADLLSSTLYFSRSLSRHSRPLSIHRQSPTVFVCTGGGVDRPGAVLGRVCSVSGLWASGKSTKAYLPYDSLVYISKMKKMGGKDSTFMYMLSTPVDEVSIARAAEVVSLTDSLLWIGEHGGGD